MRFLLIPKRFAPQRSASSKIPIPKEIVISTEAVHSLIVNSAVEKPPHFVFAITFPCSTLSMDKIHRSDTICPKSRPCAQVNYFRVADYSPGMHSMSAKARSRKVSKGQCRMTFRPEFAGQPLPRRPLALWELLKAVMIALPLHISN
jgi:hypothetical protein